MITLNLDRSVSCFTLCTLNGWFIFRVLGLILKCLFMYFDLSSIRDGHTSTYTIHHLGPQCCISYIASENFLGDNDQQR